MEKPYNITDDLEALTRLEAEITELAYTTEDMVDLASRNNMVDLASRNILLAENREERSRSMWELFFCFDQALECIDSTTKQWKVTRDSYNNMKGLIVQTYSPTSLPEYAEEQPENIMVWP